MSELLLCTDLDRTLISNGVQVESPDAMDYFKRLLEKHPIRLAYVSGRSHDLVAQAMVDYQLPQPKYVIADVGTAIYQVEADGWHIWPSWRDHLEKEWLNCDREQVNKLLSRIPHVRLQESDRQSDLKISMELPIHADFPQTACIVESLMTKLDLKFRLVWSIDDATNTRLLDLLPSRAGKLNAIRYLMKRCNFQRSKSLFAGDSGNDLDVLESNIPSVLVANASEDLRQWARKLGQESLYVAEGGFLGMNGNYVAGILEGIARFWPQIIESLGKE